MDDQQNLNNDSNQNNPQEVKSQNYYQSQNNYQQPNKPSNPEPLSMGQYLGMMLLMLIPIVNIILLFVWGFGDYNVNRKNFARAQLIMVAIGIGLAILFGIIAATMMASFSTYSTF